MPIDYLVLWLDVKLQDNSYYNYFSQAWIYNMCSLMQYAVVLGMSPSSFSLIIIKLSVLWQINVLVNVTGYTGRLEFDYLQTLCTYL